MDEQLQAIGEMENPIAQMSFGPLFVQTLESQVEPRVMDLTEDQILLLTARVDQNISFEAKKKVEAETELQFWDTQIVSLIEKPSKTGLLDKMQQALKDQKFRKYAIHREDSLKSVTDQDGRIDYFTGVRSEVEQGKVDEIERVLLDALRHVSESWMRYDGGNNWWYQEKILNRGLMELKYLSIINPQSANLVQQKLDGVRVRIEEGQRKENQWMM